MKDLPQNQDPEQLNNGSAPDGGPQKEFSLEEIMNEFGGWSRREPEKAKEAEQTAPKPPDNPPKPPEPQAETPKEPEKTDGKTGRKACRNPRRRRTSLTFVPAQSVPKADMMAQTLRFAPVEEERIRPRSRPRRSGPIRPNRRRRTRLTARPQRRAQKAAAQREKAAGKSGWRATKRSSRSCFIRREKKTGARAAGGSPILRRSEAYEAYSRRSVAAGAAAAVVFADAGVHRRCWRFMQYTVGRRQFRGAGAGGVRPRCWPSCLCRRFWTSTSS
jgi:hypothetical protein